MNKVAPEDGAELLAIADQIIDGASVGEQVEVVVGRSTSTSVRAYRGDVEALTTARTAGIGVRVIVDGRQGFASAGSLEPDVVGDLLGDARDNAAFAVPDDHVFLASPDGVAAPALELCDDALHEVSIDDKVAMAIGLEEAVLAGDPRINGVRSAAYGDRSSTSVIKSTEGVAASSSSTSASLGVLALARADGETQTGSGFDAGRGIDELDVATVATDAVLRATRLLGATQPASRKITLLLEPRLAASLLGVVAGMLSGDRALKGRTPFADRIGESIGASCIDMIDDPTNSASFGATPFDGEGLAGRATELISGGELRAFLYDTQSASRADVVSTASAVRGLRSTPGVGWHAVALRPGALSWEDLLAGVEDGVLVQSMTGLHSGVNAVSGDFSVGIDGMTIRNGELAEPIREATVASTLPKLLLDVTAVGDEVEHRPGGISCPAMSIADVSLSGS